MCFRPVRPWLPALALALAGCAGVAAPRGDGGTTLQRAIDALGGESAIAGAGVLAWRGDAVVFAGGQRIEIAVDTRVVPFEAARSTSWRAALGPTDARTMEITPGGGTVARGEARTPLGPEMLAHERAQFAIYGLMLLLPLREARVESVAVPADGPSQVRHALRVRDPRAPESLLMLDARYRLVAIDNQVPAPAPGAPAIAQRFRFEGSIDGGAIPWPRRLSIDQDGKRYFELTLREFRTEAGPAAGGEGG